MRLIVMLLSLVVGTQVWAGELPNLPVKSF
jgi:hypothetical protein